MDQGTNTQDNEGRGPDSPRQEDAGRERREPALGGSGPTGAGKGSSRSEERPMQSGPEGPTSGTYQRSASWQEEASMHRWKYTLLPKIEVPERFSGDTRRGPSIRNYVMQLENLRARWERDRLDPEEFFRGLANSSETFYRISRRELLEWAARAAPGERDPTTRFLGMLEEQFPAQTPECVSEFREFRRRTGESLLAYYGRLVELVEDMGWHDQSRLISKFMNSLHHELRRDVSVQIFDMGARATLKEAYEIVKRVETGRRMHEIETNTERRGERPRASMGGNTGGPRAATAERRGGEALSQLRADRAPKEGVSEPASVLDLWRRGSYAEGLPGSTYMWAVWTKGA
ncbi:unnamed protein product [Closterium sp. Yama58-4]|nr:unnamed protein product [Closterium sp. Yama58-4]